MNNINVGKQKQQQVYQYNIKCFCNLRKYLQPFLINYTNYKKNGVQIPFDLENGKKLIVSLLKQFNVLYLSNHQPNQLYQIIGISYLSYLISNKLQNDSLQKLLDKLQIHDFKNIPKEFQFFFTKEKLIVMIRNLIYYLKKSDSTIINKALIKLINKVPLLNFAFIMIFRGIALLGYRQWSFRLIDFQDGNQQEIILDFQKKATLLISKFIIEELKINLKYIYISNDHIEEQIYHVEFCQNIKDQIKLFLNKNRIYLLTQTSFKCSSQSNSNQMEFKESELQYIIKQQNEKTKKKCRSLIIKGFISIKNQNNKKLQQKNLHLKQKIKNKIEMVDASISANFEGKGEENLNNRRIPGQIKHQKEQIANFFQRVFRSYQNYRKTKYRYRYSNQIV